MKILLINGNAKPGSFCAALSDAYESGAVAAGREIKRIELGSLNFEPILKNGYDSEQSLEPDLCALQQLIKESDHLVLVYPVWWGGIPALLKGLLDRVLLPGFAFRYREGKPLPEKLLKGKTARLLVTMDSPSWYFRFFTGAPAHRMMKRAVLQFCGFNPVRISEFSPMQSSSDAQRQQWLAQAKALGEKGA